MGPELGRRGALLGLAVVVAVVASLVVAEVAFGCSCAGGQSAEERLQRADAALVGTIEAKRTVDASPVPRVVYTYRVEESFKRQLPATVEIETSRDDSLCGYTADPGKRHGILLSDSARNGDRYSAGICDLIQPDELRRAAGRQGPYPQGPDPPNPPPPTPEPRGTLLLAGRFGAHRLLLLDANGRTLARAGGGGRVDALDVCPGGRRVVALVAGRSRSLFVTYGLAKLARLGSSPVRTRRGRRGVDCRDRSGQDTGLRRRSASGQRGARLGTTSYRLRGRALLRDGALLRRFPRPPTLLVAAPRTALAACRSK